MKKAKITTLLILLQAAVTLPVIAAEPTTILKPARIHGTVEFVQRRGIVPGTMEPMSYWGAVIHSNGVNYELPTALGIESGVRPESVTIQGTRVHRGDEVTIDGKANRIRNDFGLVSEVRQVEIN
jgi:hypothetical protein